MKKNELINKEVLTIPEIKTLYGLSRYQINKARKEKLITPITFLNGTKMYLQHEEVKKLLGIV